MYPTPSTKEKTIQPDFVRRNYISSPVSDRTFSFGAR